MVQKLEQEKRHYRVGARSAMSSDEDWSKVATKLNLERTDADDPNYSPCSGLGQSRVPADMLHQRALKRLESIKPDEVCRQCHADCLFDKVGLGFWVLRLGS